MSRKSSMHGGVLKILDIFTCVLTYLHPIVKFRSYVMWFVNSLGVVINVVKLFDNNVTVNI